MGRLTESQLWPLVKSLVPNAVRIETGGTAQGIPDVSYTTDGHHGFIELKIARSRKNGFLHVAFRPGQIDWLETHDRLAGYVWVLLATETRMLWLIHGIHSRQCAGTISPLVLDRHAYGVGTLHRPDCSLFAALL